MYTPSSDSLKLTAHEVDTCLPMEILIDKLMKVARLGQKRGWHRDELGLSDGKHLNHTEKNQLLVEVLLLEQFIAGLGPSHKAKHSLARISVRWPLDCATRTIRC